MNIATTPSRADADESASSELLTKVCCVLHELLAMAYAVYLSRDQRSRSYLAKRVHKYMNDMVGE